jgi:hypothetical protein
MALLEYTVQCPACWQTQVVLLDPSPLNASLIQDCEVCCNPYELNYATSEGALDWADVRCLE